MQYVSRCQENNLDCSLNIYAWYVPTYHEEEKRNTDTSRAWLTSPLTIFVGTLVNSAEPMLMNIFTFTFQGRDNNMECPAIRLPSSSSLIQGPSMLAISDSTLCRRHIETTMSSWWLNMMLDINPTSLSMLAQRQSQQGLYGTSLYVGIFVIFEWNDTEIRTWLGSRWGWRFNLQLCFCF